MDCNVLLKLANASTGSARTDAELRCIVLLQRSFMMGLEFQLVATTTCRGFIAHDTQQRLQLNFASWVCLSSPVKMQAFSRSPMTAALHNERAIALSF